MDKDLYDLPAEEAAEIPKVAESLEVALKALDEDREFLTVGGVFSDDFINSYIALKSKMLSVSIWPFIHLSLNFIIRCNQHLM